MIMEYKEDVCRQSDSNHLYKKIPFTNVHILYGKGRASASSGTWLCGLLPLACLANVIGAHSSCGSSPWVLFILALQSGCISVFILRHEVLTMEAKKDNKLRDGWRHTWKGTLTNFSSHYYILSFCAGLLLNWMTDSGLVMGVFTTVMVTFVERKLTLWILKHFLDSFTIGEALLLGQAGSVALVIAFKNILVSPQADFEARKLFLFVQVALIVSTTLGYALWTLKHRLNVLCFVTLLGLSGAVGVLCSSVVLREYSPSWLIKWMLSPTRLALVGWWTNISVIIVITAIFCQRLQNEIPRTVLRKSFHFLMVLIVVPGVVLEPSLMFLAASGALMLFLLLEMVRVTKIEPFCDILDSMFAVFLDEKDSGSLVLSHVYLLAGLCLPLWLYPCDMTRGTRISLGVPMRQMPVVETPNFTLPLLAGILSVGVGDAAASVGGTYFGRHLFPGSKKTVEGSVCMVLSECILVGALIHLGVLVFSWYLVLRVVLGVALTAVVEALTDQVDNIVLPLIMYIVFV